MKRITCLVSGVLLLASAASAQQAAPPPVTLATSLQRAYADIKKNLTAAADKLSEADYGFKPSAMPEVRTYGKLFGHVANAQFGSCAAAKGVSNPNQGNNNELKTTKAEFVKALADSFAFCDDAFASLTDASALQMVTRGRGQLTRAWVLGDLIAHSNEMYGTAAVYLRAKGIVPPSTDEAAAARGQRGG
jgi:DinB superfamily